VLIVLIYFSVDCLPPIFSDLVLNSDSVIKDFYGTSTKMTAHKLPILEFIGILEFILYKYITKYCKW
jgi:hypothetical protein